MICTLTRSLPGEREQGLEPHFDEVRVFEQGRPATATELEALVRDSDVLIVTVADRVTEQLLAVAQRLKCLITFSVGLDHIDTRAVAKRGIPLCRTPNVLTDATADLTLALLLGAARRIKAASRWLEEGRWTGFDPGQFLGLELRGATLHIVGLGQIGGAVARRAQAFGMEVTYSGPQRSHPGVLARPVPLAEGLRGANVVSLHCPLTTETRHLIGRKELGLMREDGILVNTARGAIVDESALVAHLRSHPAFVAGLDVFEEEPRVTSGLAALPNALCVPHVGSATHRARGGMAQACVDEAVRFARGERLVNLVHPPSEGEGQT